MDERERFRLICDGSDARAHGVPWSFNPAYRRENQPLSSGRSVDEWKARADAWSEGWIGEDVLARFWSAPARQVDRA
jgi:hypothetical protein